MFCNILYHSFISVFSVFSWILVSFSPSVSICPPGILAFCPFLQNKSHEYSNQTSDADEDKENSNLSFVFCCDLSRFFNFNVYYRRGALFIYTQWPMVQHWEVVKVWGGGKKKRGKREVFNGERSTFPLHWSNIICSMLEKVWTLVKGKSRRLNADEPLFFRQSSVIVRFSIDFALSL